MEKEKMTVKSEIVVTKNHIEQVLKDNLAIPINAKMTVKVDRSGDYDKGTYKEVLNSLTFEWEDEV